MKSKLLTSLCLVLAGLALTGCNTDLAQTAEQTDAAVYKIIDDAWDERYGSQAN